jgi:ankyrin repeat protein
MGNTPLHSSARDCDNLDVIIIQCFTRELQCYVNVTNYEGLTPLHFAASKGHIQKLNTLLRNAKLMLHLLLKMK